MSLAPFICSELSAANLQNGTSTDVTAQQQQHHERVPCLQHKHSYASLHSLWRLPCSSIRNQGQAGNKWCMLCNLYAQFPSMDTTQKKSYSLKLFCITRVKSLGLPHSYRYSQNLAHALAADVAVVSCTYCIWSKIKASRSSCVIGVQSGVIMNRSFQPHESHVPFLLQFKVCRGHNKISSWRAC